jgi:hypothetical protein
MTGWGNVVRAAISKVLPTFRLTRDRVAYSIHLARAAERHHLARFRTCAEDERGVEGQVQDGHDYAGRIGWGIGPRLSHVIIENHRDRQRAAGCVGVQAPPAGFETGRWPENVSAETRVSCNDQRSSDETSANCSAGRRCRL